MLGAKDPPMEGEVMNTVPYKEIDILPAIKANEALEGIGDLPRPLQRRTLRR